jgi:TPR repeat protein
MLTTRFATSVSQPFAGDSAGFDYFATDFHYMNVAAEIRRCLTQQRGFVLLNGPPAPDAKLLERYLDGSTAADGSDAARFRANLVRCREGWTFGDVVIAYSRQLGLSPDAGAWSILSQVMQESRKGLMRVLILDNADALDDNGFDELRRFARVDDPYILPVVLLAGSGFADRLAVELRSLKAAVVGSLPLQHLAPDEVAAFIRYQVEPLGDSYDGAFTPGALSTIAEAAEGDPRVVNRLARQHLDAFAGPRDAAAPPLPRREEEDAPVVSGITPAAEDAAAPQEPEALSDTTVRVSGSRMVHAAEPLPMPVRRSAERLARNLAIAAGLLFVGAYGMALLYSFVSEGPSDGGARPVAAAASDKAAGAPAMAAPVQSADRRPVEPPPAPEKPAVPAKPPQAAASQEMAGSLAAAARQAASIEPSAPPPASSSAGAQPASPLPRAAAPPALALPQAAAPPAPPAPPPPATAARAAPAPSPTVAHAAPADTSRSAAPAAPAPASRAAPPPARPQTIARAEPPPAQPRAATADQAPAVTALTARGDQFLAAGDVASARDFFERAVEGGDAAASCGLAKTYDPLVLQQLAMRGVAADPTKAAAWYRRAAAAGNAEAATRLAQLLARYPQGTASEGSSQ